MTDCHHQRVIAPITNYLAYLHSNSIPTIKSVVWPLRCSSDEIPNLVINLVLHFPSLSLSSSSSFPSVFLFHRVSFQITSISDLSSTLFFSQLFIETELLSFYKFFHRFYTLPKIGPVRFTSIGLIWNPNNIFCWTFRLHTGRTFPIIFQHMNVIFIYKQLVLKGLLSMNVRSINVLPNFIFSYAISVYFYRNCSKFKHSWLNYNYWIEILSNQCFACASYP